MKKLARVILFSFMPAIACALDGHAACHEGLNEKVWDKSAAGYCRIFFPNCNADGLGKRLSYSREFAESEIVCVGSGEYTDFYKVTLVEANDVFGTDFARMGVNYSDGLSKWLFENCAELCDKKSD